MRLPSAFLSLVLAAAPVSVVSFAPPARAGACEDYNNWRMMGLSGGIGEQLRAKCALESQYGGRKEREKACADYANWKMYGLSGSIGETLRVKCYGQ